MKQGLKKKKGEEAFEEYYGNLFGSRWPSLKESLKKDVSHFSLDFSAEEKYFLDGASICASLCLDANSAESILDMCAAPGGKTLVICGVKQDSASLCSNERSAERRSRLDKVVHTVLPEKINGTVTVTCSDGAVLCRKQTECYDAILLDAPCSSERHVLNDKKYLDQWSPSRIKNLAMEQWALLSSAWRMLKNGGRLLYATCALSPLENDEVVSRLFRKFDNACTVPHDEVKKVFEENLSSFKAKISYGEYDDASEELKRIFSRAERTEYGFHVLPDSSDGAGPLYFAALKK